MSDFLVSNLYYNALTRLNDWNGIWATKTIPSVPGSVTILVQEQSIEEPANFCLPRKQLLKQVMVLISYSGNDSH